MGRKDVDDAEQWAWDVIKVGIAIMVCLDLPMAIAPELLLSAFIADEPEALAMGVLPLRLAGLTIWIEAILMVLLNSIMGAGATTIGLVVNVETVQGLARLRALVPGVPLAPVSGDDLAERLGLRHYPVLITATGIEQ